MPLLVTVMRTILRNCLLVFFTDDQFDEAFHHSEHLFSRACSIVEAAEGWGVGDWQAAASWTVTAMVHTLNWDGSDVDGGNANTDHDDHSCGDGKFDKQIVTDTNLGIY